MSTSDNQQLKSSNQNDLGDVLQALAAELVAGKGSNSDDIALRLLELAKGVSTDTSLKITAGNSPKASQTSTESATLRSTESVTSECTTPGVDLLVASEEPVTAAILDDLGKYKNSCYSGETLIVGNQDLAITNPHFCAPSFDFKLAEPVEEAEHQERVHQRTFFGTHPVAGQAPLSVVGPLPEEFLFKMSELSCDPPPAEVKLTRNAPALAPADVYYPLAPADGYELKLSRKYLRGYVYVARYNLDDKNVHRELLLKTSVPPNISPKFTNGVFVSEPLSGMIEMIPGIPFALAYNGNFDRLHTVGCVQTLKSLRSYSDYPEILQKSVNLAKLTWGCSPNGRTPELKPIYELPGLKENDRSAKRTAFHHSTLDGSYSLASTVIKGEGQGTFAPAIQANTSDARIQIASILEVLNSLYQLVMPKCISKFEKEIIDFHSMFNNVLGFGGLGPNGTSVQMNVSSGPDLKQCIGRSQGGIHCDVLDCLCHFTFLSLLLRICKDADPGPFCLGRPGLYIREKDAWIQFLVFKGVDLHFGHAPSEDPDAHKKWVEDNIDSAWNLAGPQNRVAYVTYFGHIPSNRAGSLNISPPTMFGNYGSSQVHKDQQKNFAMHGLNILGNKDAYANKLGAEIVSNFWNSLQLCDLDLEMDLADLFNKITFEDRSGEKKTLKAPLYLPDAKDVTSIKRLTSLWLWHSSEAQQFYISLPKSILSKSLKRPLAQNTASIQKPFALPSGISELAMSNIPPATQPSEATDLESLPTRIIKSLRGRSKTAPNGVLPDLQIESPQQPDDGEEYEVDKIIDHRQNEDGSYTWLVKWKYHIETDWLSEMQLENCIELLSDYNHIHGISAESVKPSMKGGKRQKHVNNIISLGSNLKTLRQLFSVSLLNEEVHKLNDLYTTPKPPDYFKSVNMSAIIGKWGDQVEQIVNLGDLLDREEAKHPDIHTIGKSLLRLKAVQVSLAPDYSVVDTQFDKLAIIKRSAKHETCLALVSVFEWYSHIGPLSAEYLIKEYLDKGHDYLQQQSLAVANLIDHIVQYVYQKITEYQATSKKKTKFTLPQRTFALTLPAHTQELLPSNLYGLAIDGKSSKPCTLPEISQSKMNKIDCMQGIAIYCLQEVISKFLIMPKLRIVDRNLVTGKNTDFSEIKILERSITRGAILWAVQQACEGDGIFSATKIDVFLRSPAILFDGSFSREHVFSPAVIKGKERVLTPLIKWIKAEVEANPEVIVLSQRLRELQHHLMFEIFQGYSSPMEKDMGLEEIEKTPTTTQRSSKTLNIGPGIPETLPSDYESLLIGGNSTVQLGKAFLIVQEALNDFKQAAPSNEVLFRVLKGQHGTTSSTTKYNPDHTNPIRGRLCSANLFETYMASKPITSCIGISNLLAWFGTGQGFKTSDFLHSLDAGFFCSTLDEMVSNFQNAVDKNISLATRHSGSKLLPQMLPGYLAVDDSMIWGQPCNDLRLNPSKSSKQLTITEKLEQYWTDQIQEQWKILLGELYDQDLSTYSGKKPKWHDIHDFLKNLKVNGFKTGLTPFQLCISLALIGVSDPPTLQDIASFICTHRQLGAWRALVNLGFSMPDKPQLLPVLIAFTSVYKHLEIHLSEEDKEILCFGPIFVEHLLCKISRWDTRLRLEGSPGFLTSAAKVLEKDYTKNSGPFPPEIEKEFILQIVKEIKDF